MSPAIIASHADKKTRTAQVTFDARYVDDEHGLDEAALLALQRILSEARINFMLETLSTEEVSRDENTITVRISAA